LASFAVVAQRVRSTPKDGPSAVQPPAADGDGDGLADVGRLTDVELLGVAELLGVVELTGPAGGPAVWLPPQAGRRNATATKRARNGPPRRLLTRGATCVVFARATPPGAATTDGWRYSGADSNLAITALGAFNWSVKRMWFGTSTTVMVSC
jgi:hypothetical protein